MSDAEYYSKMITERDATIDKQGKILQALHATIDVQAKEIERLKAR